MLRRSALDEIGGIAVETVTEDAHTSLRMHMHGWNTAYINIPQAAGLATERLSAHVGQRIRWARGMIQILRIDNPLFAPGLTFAQRLCYFNAMIHFLYSVPRLIFLSAPLIYLLLSHTNVPGYWAAILAYALPHLILSNVTNSRIQGEHRHSFWNEIYETVLSPYILLPTLMALINPKLGKFNVTAKGGVVKRTFFDSKIAQPFLILLLFNIAGLLLCLPRFFIWDRDRPGTVVMNMIWCSFNIIILGVTTAVSREMRQLRTTVRINIVTPVMVRLADGRLASGDTIDMSSGGTSIRLSEVLDANPLDELHLVFPLPGVASDLPATVVSVEGSVLRVRFENLTITEQEVLTMVLYSRADSWLGWGETRESDNVLRSLGRIFQISMHGLLTTFQSLFTRRGQTAQEVEEGFIPAGGVVGHPLYPGGSAGGFGAGYADMNPSAGGKISGSAAGSIPSPAPINADSQSGVDKSALPAPPPGQFRDTFSLSDAGSPQIEMHGIDSSHTVYFTLPQTHVARTAKIHIYYAFSPSLLTQLSHIKLILNGTLFATIQPVAGQSGGTASQTADAEFAIPADLLVHNNALTIQFIGHYTMVCEDPANTALWGAGAPQYLFGYPGRPAAVGRRPEAIADAISRSRCCATAQPAYHFRFRSIAEGGSGGGRIGQLLRHDVGGPAGAVPGTYRGHSAGQCHRHFGSCRQPASGAGSLFDRLAHGGRCAPTPTTPTARCWCWLARTRTRCCRRRRRLHCIRICCKGLRPPSTQSSCPTNRDRIRHPAGLAPTRPSRCGIM